MHFLYAFGWEMIFFFYNLLDIQKCFSKWSFNLGLQVENHLREFAKKKWLIFETGKKKLSECSFEIVEKKKLLWTFQSKIICMASSNSPKGMKFLSSNTEISSPAVNLF